MTVVLDASWWVRLMEDARRPRAARVQALHPRLVARHDPVVPELLNYELLNAVHRQDPDAVGGDLAHRTAVVQTVLAGLDFAATAPGDLEWIGRLTEEHGLTAYDAAYLTLAKTHPEAILVTLDTALHAAGRAVLGDGRCLDLDGVDAHLAQA